MRPTLFVVPLVMVVLLMVEVIQATQNSLCSTVRQEYSRKGFKASDVPERSISGEHLRICPQGFTCCTEIMEAKLNAKSQDDYAAYVADQIQLIHTTYISKTARFDGYFTKLLDDAYRDLDEMFTRTYGLLYRSNSGMFKDLFTDLRGYYKGDDTNLLDVLDSFFATLLQKMFKLLNAQYVFDNDYLQCVSEHMDDLSPFGDVPQKLSTQVKRSFVAARTFVQGLTIGRDVILAVSKMQPTQSCRSALMKMMYCPYCRISPYVKPCNDYCMNVMKGCLAQESELNSDWNLYTDAMIKVAERLQGPFNIETVVDPIDVKISEAIMNLQENSDVVKAKVFQGCGQPQMQRKKREAEAESESDDQVRRSITSSDPTNEYSYQRGGRTSGRSGPKQRGRHNKNNNGPNINRHNNQQEDVSPPTSLERLVKDIMKKIANTRDFWSNLPHAICNTAAAGIRNDTHCWNGVTTARYQPEVTRDGLFQQNNNPEVEVDVRRPNAVIQQQLIQLRTITTRLKNAYNGLDVDWIDTSDAIVASGSGHQADAVGSGSGGGAYNEEFNFVDSKRYQPDVYTHYGHDNNRNRMRNQHGNNQNTNNNNNMGNNQYEYVETRSLAAAPSSTCCSMVMLWITMLVLHVATVCGTYAT